MWRQGCGINKGSRIINEVLYDGSGGRDDRSVTTGCLSKCIHHRKDRRMRFQAERRKNTHSPTSLRSNRGASCPYWVIPIVHGISTSAWNTPTPPWRLPLGQYQIPRVALSVHTKTMGLVNNDARSKFQREV